MVTSVPNPPKPEPKLYGHRYPWDAWLARRAFALVRGTDFVCEPTSMAVMLRVQVLNRGLERTIRVRGNVVEVGPKTDFRGRRRASRA